MRKLLLGTASALLLLGAAGAANAAVPQGTSAQPFLVMQNEQHQDMNVAANLVQASLNRRPDGTALVSEDLCRKTRSCITPLEIYQAIKDKHPDVGLGPLSELPAYMRSLAKNENPKPGKRTVGRVLDQGGTRSFDWSYQREPFTKEVTWNDPNTGEEVFMGHCLNVIDLSVVAEVKVTANDCIVARIPVNERTTNVRTAILGSTPISDARMRRCLAYKYPGDVDFTPGWKDDCRWGTWKDADGSETTCQLGTTIAFTRKQPKLRGGFNLKQGTTGYVEVRLPSDIGSTETDLGFWVCLQEGEGAQSRHAPGMITTPDDFQYPPEGESGGKRVTFPAAPFGVAPGQTITASR